MRVGTVRKPYILPPRQLFDVVAANDVTSLLTAVRGVNPFDESPGMKIILSKIGEIRPESANLYVEYTNEVEIDPKTISSQVDARGNTPLHVAAHYGYVHMIDILFHECSCPLDARNDDGFTPLHLAAMEGHLECVRLLCNLGADVAAFTYGSSDADDAVSECECDKFFLFRSPLFLAHWKQHHTVAALLLNTPVCASPTLRNHEEQSDDRPKSSSTENAILVAFRKRDLLTFVSMFDYLDCLHRPCGELPLTWGNDALPAFAQAAPTILEQLVSKTSRLDVGERFIFDGFVTRGFLRASAVDIEKLADKIVQNGHYTAFVTLLGCGYLSPDDLHRLSSLASSSLDASNALRLSLDEWEASLLYKDAMKVYRQSKPKKNVKDNALQCKKGLRLLQKELEKQGLKPLETVAQV